MAPEILLLGANGQVGWELRRSLAPIGRITALTRAELDLSDLDGVMRAVRAANPAIIINAAAYTAVDKAETEQAAALRLNADLPAVLADEAKRADALLVDYSTDYVFDGTLERPYVEEDTPNPLSIYGRSKLEGLRAIQQTGCRYLVFRVSWVYGAHGANFVKTILRLARERSELRVVADQVGAPTPADLIADVTAQCLAMLSHGKGEEGVYHLAPAGNISWHGFSQAIVAEARELGEPLSLEESAIRPIVTGEFPLTAVRPVNSALNTGKLKSTFGLHLPDWNTPLPRIVQEIFGK